jgi:hypothetical protein
MSAAGSVDGLLRSSQFAQGLLVGGAATVVVRIGDTLVDRWHPQVDRSRRRTGLIALIPPLALVGWMLVHHTGLRGGLPAAAVVSLTALGAPLIAALDFDLGDGRLTALALALGAAGVWACVPDTEVARGVLGACVAATVVWVFGPRRQLGWVAVVAICIGVATAIAWGARGRPAAAIGAAGCLSLLALLPIVNAALTRSGRSLPSLPVLAVIDGVVVLLASRWVGLRDSTRSSAVAMLVVVVLATAALWACSRKADRQKDRARSNIVGGGRRLRS